MKKAFTLIELLVVIAIIAILAAILFPVFAQAKVAAKKTVALSNAKNLGLAVKIYMSDYDDSLIKSFYGFPADGVSWGSVFYNWRMALNSYTGKNKDILTDPTNAFSSKNYWPPAQWDGSKPDTDPSWTYLAANYSVNNHVIGFANGNVVDPNNTPPGLDSESQIDDIAGTIIIVPTRHRFQDVKWDFGDSRYGYGWWCQTSPGNYMNGANAVVCPGAGQGMINSVSRQVSFVWADGHAKGMAYKASFQQADHWHTATDPKAPTQAQRDDVAANVYSEYN